MLYLTGPPEDFVPEHLVGELALAVLVTYAGGEPEARTAMAPMLALRPEGQMVTELPYAELQYMLDDPPGYVTGTTGRRSTWTRSPTRPWTGSALAHPT